MDGRHSSPSSTSQATMGNLHETGGPMELESTNSIVNLQNLENNSDEIPLRPSKTTFSKFPKVVYSGQEIQSIFDLDEECDLMKELSKWAKNIQNG